MIDWVTRLLFEEPVLLVTAELIALAVVLAIHRRRFTDKSRRMVWTTLAICALLLVIQKLTITRREALMAMIQALARAVDQGDVPAIAARLDETFADELGDRSAFLDWARLALQHGQVNEARVGGFEIIFTAAGQARASFRATCDWRSDSHSQRSVRSVWRVDCVRRPDGWKLTRIERGDVVTPWGAIGFREARRY